MRVKRLLLILTLTLGVPVLVLVAALAVLVTSEAGTRFAAGWAREFVPAYTFGAVRGTLIRGLEVESLDLSGQSWSATVRRVAFIWHPRALLSGRLALEELVADGVDVTLQPSAPDATSLPTYPRLPLAVSVAALTIDGLTVRQGDGAADVQHIERLTARVQAGPSRLEVSALEVVLARARLAGEVGIADGDVLAVSARLTAQIDTEARVVEATLTLAGRLDALQVEGNVTAGLDARFGGRVDVLHSPPVFDVTVDVDSASAGGDTPDYQVGPVRIHLTGTPLAARITATGPLEQAALGPRDATVTLAVDRVTGDPPAYAGRFTWQLRADAATPQPELAGHGTFDYVGDRLTLTHDSAAPVASTLSAELRGLGATPELAATLVVSAALLPIPDEQPLELERATFTARGDMAALAVSGELSGRQARVGPLTLAFGGTVEEARRLVLERIDVGLFDGRLTATGAIEFAADLAGSLRFSASGLNLGHLLPEVDTRLGFDGRATFASRAGGPTGELVIEQLSGVWREQTVSGRASLAYDGVTLEVGTLELALGANAIALTARLGDSLAGRFTLDAPDLGAFAPGFAGRLAATGELSGKVAQPAAQASIDGARLRYGDWSLARLEGELDVDLASAATQRLSLKIEDIRQARVRRGSATISLDGTLGNHRASVELAGGPQSARLALHGAWADQAWRGVIDSAEFELGDLGAWTLAAPVKLSYADSSIAAERACLRADLASLCVTVPNWSSSTGDLALELSAVPLESFAPLLPTTLRAHGNLMATAAVAQADGRITASGHAAVADGRLELTGEGDEIETLAIPLLRTEFTLDPTLLDARVTAEIDRWMSLTGEVRYGLTPDGRLDGKLRAHAVDLAWVEAFLPDLAGTRGTAELVARLDGTVANPVIDIAASLSDGAVVVQQTGMRISILRVSARSNGDRRVVLDGTLGNADGTLALAGHVDLDADAGWPGQVTVKSERFAAVRLPEVEADLAPDLTIDFSTARIDIGGSLALPRVHVDIKQLPDAAVTVSTDEVIVGSEQSPDDADAPPDFFVDKVSGKVDLQVGDDVWIMAAGLRARLTGSMRWGKVRGARVGRGEGRISIAEGGYQAYGQNLRIERGHLTFAGAIDNPALDVRAVRADIDEDVVAGVLVNGDVRAPQFDLFSEPALPDSDILSYIITGRGLDSASSGDASVIARAALSLGAERSSMVTSRVQDAFGLDELSVNTGATAEQTSLTAGKRLTPKLSVRSEFNPFDRLWSFFLNYKLTTNWSVEAQSGARQGADVIYSIERDDLWPPAWFGDD